MKIGFTGSRKGMTESQKVAIKHLLCELDEVHHGDCVGADSEFHTIAISAGCTIMIHPPDKSVLRAFCEGNYSHAPTEYLQRNKNIVDSTNILIACPRGEETLRSGTWSTIRYANKKGKYVIRFQ